MISPTLLELGKKIDNYIVDATDNAATNAKWTSTTVQEFTVPAGKRWFLFGGTVTTDANNTVIVTVTDGTNTLMTLASHAAQIGEVWYPEADNVGNIVFPLPLDAGDEVLITCGGAQGAGAKATCLVVEVEV